jgi:hypothetical protein
MYHLIDVLEVVRHQNTEHYIFTLTHNNNLGQYRFTPSEYREGEDSLDPRIMEQEIRRVPEGTPYIPRLPSAASHHGIPVSDRRTTRTARTPSPESDRLLPTVHHTEETRPLPVRPFPTQPSAAGVHPAGDILRHDNVTPFDVRDAETERERLERLGEAESRLHNAAVAAQEAEDMREAEFRQHEEDRERLFLDMQQRRDQEARERADGVWHDLDTRLATLGPAVSAPAPQPPGSEPPDVVHQNISGSDGVSIRSVRTAAQQAASQHATDILEVIKAERDEFAREREEAALERDRLLAEAEAARVQAAEERDERIRALEQELAAVKNDLEAERQQRMSIEAEAREQESRALMERDEAIHNQLGDITNLVQDQRDICEEKKVLNESRWADKENRRIEKEDKWNDLRNIVKQIQDELTTDREKADEERIMAARKPGTFHLYGVVFEMLTVVSGVEEVLDELRKQNEELKELLAQFSESA